jgi:hypothetical protein
MLGLLRFRRRKRCLTVAPMPLPEAIPVEEAELAAVFAEFDVVASTQNKQEETVQAVGEPVIVSRPDQGGEAQTLLVVGEALSEPIMAHAVVIGV